MNILEKYGLKKEEWNLIGEWNQPLLSAFYWVNWFDKDQCKEMDLEIGKKDIFYINGYYLFNEKNFPGLKEKIELKLREKDEEFFKKIYKIMKEKLEAHRFIDLKEGSLIERFEKFHKSDLQMMNVWYLSYQITEYIGQILENKVKESGLDMNEVLESLQPRETLVITHHKKIVELKKKLIQEDLFDLLKEDKDKFLIAIKNKKEISLEIEKIIKEYGWIGTHQFWGEIYNIQKILSDLRNIKDLPDKKSQKEFNGKIQFIIDQAEEFSYFRQYSAECFSIPVVRYRELFNEIGKELGISYDELIYLTSDEIIVLINDKEKANLDEINARKQGYVILNVNGKCDIVSNKKEFNEFFDIFIPKYDKSKTELIGRTANKGYAKGKAKIFLEPENMEKMNDGDILVTTMTTPDFVPLMKKAAAIVTDVGGLLSHASIISREMGKPCVIGTKEATKILKDDDWIEVDAVKGIVRKIKQV
ncbi:MAG: PEP-utilizing enzyme [Candidatus Woesearchaeota archaeon]